MQLLDSRLRVAKAGITAKIVYSPASYCSQIQLNLLSPIFAEGGFAMVSNQIFGPQKLDVPRATP